MHAESAVTTIRQVSLLDDDSSQQFASTVTEMALEALADPGGVVDRRLRGLANHLPIGVWAVDEHGVFTQSFGRLLRPLGLADDELVGLSIAAFGGVAAAAGPRRTGDAPRVFRAEGSLGGIDWVHTVYTVARPDSKGTLAVSVDITEQVVAERLDVERTREMGESEARFRLLAEHAPIGIFLIGDRSVLTYANPHLEDLLQLPRHQIEGRPWLEFVHPDDLTEARRVDLDAPSLEEAPAVFEFRLQRSDGTVRWVRSRFSVLDDGGTDGSMAIGTLADITDSLAAAERLRESHDRTSAIVEAAAEGIVTCDDQMVIVEFNAAAERICGYDSADVIGRPVSMLVADDHRERFLHYFEDYRSGGRSGRLGPTELHITRPDGAVVPVELTVTDVHTSDGRLFIGMVHDISERKAFESELERLATRDQSTGLPNRVMATAHLSSVLERARRRRRPVTVLFVGLDRVKTVTDALGHAAGEELVRMAALRLSEVVEPVGTAARFGSAEFVVVSEELSDVAAAASLAERIATTMQRAFQIGDEEAFISADVGIAVSVAGEGTAEALMSNADVAYYQAKNRSDQSYDVFDAEMRAWVESHRKLEIAVRYGIERDEFELHYQPIVELESGRPVGVEALARWNHPMLGLLAPKEFIPLAEDTGLIVALGERLLVAACGHLARWQQRWPDTFVSVNLSGRQLPLPELVPSVEQALADAARIRKACTSSSPRRCCFATSMPQRRRSRP